MGRTLVEKILDAHLVEGEATAGTEVGIRVDQTLTQDATGTMAYLQFEAMGFDRVRTEVSVSYVDHNTVQEGFENADDHAYLQSVARKYGIVFSRPGNGICHQVHLERFGLPGKTLLGADSHTPTGGGIGMVAIGAGGLDVAVAMGGGLFYLVWPRVVKVNLTGTLKPWVTAKDVILHVLSVVSTKGNVGCVLEYGGPGVARLSVPERATIANMGAETGVTTSVFPSDETTRAFLVAQGRGEGYVELSADPGAVYDRVIDVNLAKVVPLAACPHSPGTIKPLRELAGMKVDQVCIGSCTNASYRDLMTVSKLLKGRSVAPQLSLGVANGSRQVQAMLAANGSLAGIISAGARILENACGFCIGNSMAPKSGGVSLRTSNRNFEGRSGTKDAQVYLVSPEAAVAAALAGEIVDPRDFFAGVRYPRVKVPARFAVDDSMMIQPDGGGEVVRGPNIGAPPTNTACPDEIAGQVTAKVGDKITTDHISPAGNRLKYRSNIPRYAEFVFEREDPEFAARAAANRDKGVHNVIVAGESYGQGSSREHAAICPMFLGVKMVVAKSMERIHKANLVNSGIVPAFFANPDDYAKVAMGDALRVTGVRAAVESGDGLVMRNETCSVDIPLRVELSARERRNLLAGGLINATRGG